MEGLEPGPRSFAQTERTRPLYEQGRAVGVAPLRRRAAAESLWDLYCGVGGFALATRAGFPRVTGLECPR